MNIKSIKEMGDIKGKKVIVRFDFNVPIQDGKVVDDLRIKKSLQTLSFLRNAGAKTIIISHIEAKDGSTITLEPVADYLKILAPLNFVKDFLNKDIASVAVDAMNNGDVVLFENLRLSKGEKKNDLDFSAYLASFGDMYVNDAFSVSHREHASVVGVPKLLPHYAGFNLIEEIENLNSVANPERPFLFILGGAKFETKMPLIQKFIDKADSIFVGGALMNNFFKEQGLNVGKSLVSEGTFNLVELSKSPKVILPIDVVVKTVDGSSHVKFVQEVSDTDWIVDVGPASVEKLAPVIFGAKLILWNGPMGNYEEGFKGQTLGIAKLIVDSGVNAVLGGGDTTAAVASLGLDGDSDRNTIFVSTGGGAMLEYLLNETLPGIDALK
ncbi:MAG: phosphoglycerate kinase [Patescibacteria group bacterium]